MTPALELAPELANLERVRSHLARLAAALGLGGELAGQVSAAGARAFCAVCLQGGDHPAELSLRREADGLRLRVCFTAREPDWPRGLSPALYCPPARRVNYLRREHRAVWTAVWEDVS